jgi:hypothetical protein
VYTRAMASTLLILLCIPNAHADKLEAATKGKKQTVQPHYGEVSSFDGTTIIFDEPLSFGETRGVGPEKLRDDTLPQSTTVPTQYTVKDTEIVITLGERDTQEPVDAGHPEFSVPGKIKDPDLLQAKVQKEKTKAGKTKATDRPVERDLTRCSGRGVDQVVEKDPRSNGATKIPVRGELQSIANGIVTLRRAPDTVVMKYRLDTLTELRIGMCP